MAALIADRRPKEGWKNEREAAKSVFTEASELSTKLSMHLEQSQLANRLTQWIKEDGSVVRAAFLGEYAPESN